MVHHSHMRMDLQCLCFLFLAGSLGEIPALEAMLSNPDDIMVNVHQWRWSSHQPWPPLKSVLGTQFWSGAQYKKIRDHLLRPSQTVQLTPGGSVCDSGHLGQRTSTWGGAGCGGAATAGSRDSGVFPLLCWGVTVGMAGLEFPCAGFDCCPFPHRC